MRNREGKFLLVHTTKKGRNRWEFPGGKLDEGERPMDAACRETGEETGAQFDYAVYVCSRDIDIDGDSWTISYWFAADGFHGEVTNKEPDKADAVGWFTAHEMSELPQIPKLCVDVARFFLEGRH